MEKLHKNGCWVLESSQKMIQKRVNVYLEPLMFLCTGSSRFRDHPSRKVSFCIGPSVGAVLHARRSPKGEDRSLGLPPGCPKGLGHPYYNAGLG